MSEPVFEIFRDRLGKFRFRLKASDGSIVAVSEGYESKEGLSHAIETIRNIAPKAKTRETTLQELARDVKEIKETQFRQEEHSNISFYFGALLGGLIGVIGNFFVSYLVMTPPNIAGLIISGILLIVTVIVLLYQVRKQRRAFGG